MRYLAIDYGGKRTGLALCDKDEMIASPIAVIENRSQVLHEILNIVKNEQVEAIILGFPFNMDGTEGPAAKGVREFAKELTGRTNIPIIFHDERLSSFEAGQKLAAADYTRKKKKKRLDAVAAAGILQSFLEKKHESAKPKLNIVIKDDYELLSHRVLELFVDIAREAIENKDVFYFAISGGNTPKRFFELLGRSQASLSLSWEKIHIFWVDERCVPPDSQQSNYKLAADTFLSKIGIRPENIHRIIGESPNLEAAANDYSVTIRKVFNIDADGIPVFDLIILGMGTDGHTASLFLASPALCEKEHLAVPVCLSGNKINRITLTVPVLLTASRLFVVVAGSDKAQALHNVFSDGPDTIQYPIRALWPAIDKITWLVDVEAARLVENCL
jgi:6-phosphogluconolactonase